MTVSTLGAASRLARIFRDRFSGATSGTTRVWVLAAALGTLAAGFGLVMLPGAPPAHPPVAIPWPLLLLTFYVAEAKVIHLHVGQSAHSFSLTEFPLVAGLLMVSPTELVTARLLGSAIALSFNRRQTPVKLAFNLAQFALSTMTSLAIVHLARESDGGLGPSLWVAVIVAMVVENLISVVSISTAISLADATPQYRRIPEMLKIGLTISLANTSLALMCLTVVWTKPEAGWLFIIPVVTVFVSYRAYISERQQHQSLELLYESTRIVQRSPQLETALIALLGHARTMFRADVAEICLLPPRHGDDVLRCRVGPGDARQVMQPIGPALDDPAALRAVAERRAFLLDDPATQGSEGGRRTRRRLALVAPLLGESSLIGTMMVAPRRGDFTPFDATDLKLFETLASHTAIALENGQLEQSLEQLGRLKEELNDQATHDSLTRLANRAVFIQAVAQRLESTEANDSIPVVLFLDLDDFKVVNDTLGHATGDALLVAVGDRLRAAVRPSDVTARLGGDEFGILIWDHPDLKLAGRLADRLRAAMTANFELDGHETSVRASIGVAPGRPGIDAAGDVVRNADVAMYSAKAHGKGRVAVFQPAMHRAVIARAKLSADLEHAIAAREFALRYQPIVRLSTGQLVGVEALVRWQHPTRGRIGPAEFIQVAEETGAILDIGRWVLREACRQMATWNAFASPLPFTVNVNASAREAGQPTFVHQVLATIGEAGIDPARVVIEMTETALLQDWKATQAKLHSLRDAGLGIAVDDFGTGYSSLSYLQRFPVTELKIARDFVSDDPDPERWQLASSIIALGRALRLKVIAEGVEHRSQLQRLRGLGCDYAQGYYLARPLESAAIQALVARGGILYEPHEVDPKLVDMVARPAGRATRRRAGTSTGDGSIAKEFPVPRGTKGDYGPIPTVRKGA
jgi:diguanylate cyclase (GGDEF)-like protein